ncbi:C40 family peptidase [Nocardioides hungaricus]
MLKGRQRLITLLCLGALVATVGLLPSTASAKPDIDDVQARVDRLYRQAEQAQERYNDAQLELTSLRRDLDLLEADQGRQDRRLAAVRRQVQDAVVRQYQGQTMAAVGRVVVSEDPQGFLSSLSTMSAFNDMQDQLFEDYATELKSLDIRSDATARRAAQVAAIEKRLAAEKKVVDDKLAEAQALLGQLEAEEREALLSRDTVRTPSDVPASGRAAAAIRYAMAQIGDAYVYGAAGPDAFDCSGLTMMAWAQAGVSLPHSSAAQYDTGTRIAFGDLQPGDLVFYYSPISHVALYIGNGMIANAANPSDGVLVQSVNSMPYTGAVRPG